jgi:hypothetical protein
MGKGRPCRDGWPRLRYLNERGGREHLDMHIVISICGMIWIGAGVLLWSVARMSTHEIFACMLVSFGVAFLGLAVIIQAINRLHASPEITGTGRITGEPRYRQ